MRHLLIYASRAFFAHLNPGLIFSVAYVYDG